MPTRRDCADGWASAPARIATKTGGRGWRRHCPTTWIIVVKTTRRSSSIARSYVAQSPVVTPVLCATSASMCRRYQMARENDGEPASLKQGDLRLLETEIAKTLLDSQ